MTRVLGLLGRGASVAGAMAIFFTLKVGLGLALLRASTAQLDARAFVEFSQLFLWLALLSTISAAGVQSGLTRQVALARGNPIAERRSFAAAGRIWLMSSLVMVALSFLLQVPISWLLVGDETLAPAIPAIGFAAAIGGLGVLACAALNGRRRAPVSLGLQSIGLLVGGGSCLLLISRGNPILAVLAYSAGGATTSLLSLIAVRACSAPSFAPPPMEMSGNSVLGEKAVVQGSEVRLLLQYSVAFLATATVLPATLFALRGVYQSHYGTVLLSYWLAANRVSDVTSQLLGLYMGQMFLPQAAHEDEPVRLRRLVILTFIGATAVMSIGWLVFAVEARFFTTTFLSPTFLPAIPFISGYLLGDALRVGYALGSNLMMAKGRPTSALKLEVLVAACLGSTVLALTTMGWPSAPYIGHVITFGVVVSPMAFLMAIRSTKTSVTVQTANKG